jgi:hypothetical protein
METDKMEILKKPGKFALFRRAQTGLSPRLRQEPADDRILGQA